MATNGLEQDQILDILEVQKCALFIGPGMLIDDNGQLLESAMWENIVAQDKDNSLIRTYYKDDGFVLLAEENCRRRLVSKIKRFYEKDHSAATQVLTKIAKLPVPLIFNLTKHNLLGAAFEAENLPFHFDFYFKGHPFKPFIAPSADKPLVYNLLGDLSEKKSLILTHKDLFEYLESIFTGNSMSPELRKMIQDTDTFIFLGLPFEKWYMQLLLRVLYHISSSLGAIEQYASIPETKGVNQFFEDEFKIKFLPNDGMSFIDGVFKICKKEGMLKTEKVIPKPKDMEEALSAKKANIALLLKKIEAFRQERLIAADPEVKYQLDFRIEELTKQLKNDKQEFEQLKELLS
jgi:hypothetical protein